MNIIKKVTVFVMGLVVIGVVSTTIGVVTQTKTVEKSVTFELLENDELAFNVYDKINDYADFNNTNYANNLVSITFNGDLVDNPQVVNELLNNTIIVRDGETDDPTIYIYNDNTYNIDMGANVGDVIIVTFEPEVIETPFIVKTLLVLIPLVLTASVIGYIAVKKGDE